ncbi:hydrogenobyrinic acid a,c-diamide synthase (glutamine-hydrolysing) /cobyrinate a,c-diamide synthase [Thiogranum longum]|uniref:Cobyrinate a,c-diamide synthase n=1 Tax=Thiogranum longum TaxID=1537524 RepID=A0A4R1HAY2_9GAMM|nr:cobyrinate a,c-diamide synthase [Thiogranum longum]TCK18518.1 hydrogenobyrinic acid a,c-diamide synthase (glutamine-hydrolysing) /cobyrinate a,c-diamide synthase [Thiogranum longum]
MSQILISAAHKSSGKTTITIGLCAALRQRGLDVQPFKKGPDYIDPMWLGRAAGKNCHNLDFYTMQREEICNTLAWFGQSADINIIEGNKGLYDGLDLDGSNSNAALAKLVGAPVVLVLDARGMTRGIAPLILGYQAFDPDINIAGVILNQLGGSRHESKLRAVIENYTDVTVLGAVARHPDMEILERHLGLIPSNEEGAAEQHIRSIGNAIERQVDLDRLMELAACSPLPAVPVASPFAIKPLDLPLRIGIARDEAFGFYYPADLDAMTQAGAELVFIDTLRDAELPPLDGLFIGGGFPESCMEKLQANLSLREAIRRAIEAGLPVYAECGGLMYLSRSLTWNDRRCEMVGAVPGDTIMHTRPQGRGYVRLRETDNPLWPAGSDDENEIAAHEFHYSGLENLEPPANWEYNVLRGTGIDGKHDGYRLHNLLACYTHQRSTSKNRWTERFLHFIQTCKTRHN